MKKIVVAIPHSHTWFWTQTCVASLHRNPPKAAGYEVQVVVVDNSPWSPAIRGITETSLCRQMGLLGAPVEVYSNNKQNKFHASALDYVVENFDFDLLMALETDVLALRPGWLQWFVDQMCEEDYAVGHWHHEQFVNPSCTLYRGSVLRDMRTWCKMNAEPTVLRWGQQFEQVQEIAARLPERDYASWFGDNVEWVAGPFADKRGWPPGTVLKEQPSGQLKGPGWYEPGQMLHHYAVDRGHTYTVCPTMTTDLPGVHGGEMPVQTLYGPWGHNREAAYPPTARLAYGEAGTDPHRQQTVAEMTAVAETAHLWGGTRALDIIKHEVTCNFVKANTPFWLAREARFWLEVVPPEVQHQTLELIRKHGWHYRGQSNDVPGGNDRDRAAAAYVRECYALGGVTW